MMTVGFDFGSVCTKAVLLGADGSLLLSVYRRKEAGDLQAVAEFLAAIERRCPGERIRVGITGADPGSAGRGTLLAVSNIIAVAAGVQHMGSRARTIVEIGGHTSKFIVCDANDTAGRIREFATNDACAAGTGAFLEQQARRLDLTVEDLSALSRTAARPATIAGRCAVFAKSDMIHLQQKGTPVDEIAFGLCAAICRNALATLLKGRDAETPVVIAGGCAHNHGILRAFTESLGRRDDVQLQPSVHPGLEAAIGAAVAARNADTEALTTNDWRGILAAVIAACAAVTTDVLPTLIRPATSSRRPEPDAVWPQPAGGFLGVDVGSVSTDFAVLDAAGDVLAAVYLPTRGRPVEVVREGLAILKTRFADGLRVLGCATTGSGRHLAGKLLGADVIKNEITCQLLGIRGIRLCSPNGREMLAAFGIEALKRFYLGLLAIDLLVKAACEIRPYETERGRTAEIHRRNLRRIEAAIAGNDVLEALDAALGALAGVPMARTRRRPVVGVAGDIYTKANAAANSDLYQWLEDQDLEVWPSPFQVDLLDFDIIRHFRHSVAHLELPELLISSTLALRRAYQVWRVRHVVGRRLEHLHEPGYLELKALAGPYMPNEEHRLLYINVAKIVDFARHGADGIINAISLNCMVGNASAAIIEKIRRDYDDIPIITAVYAGGEDPARRLGLEAFVSQVKAHRQRGTR